MKKERNKIQYALNMIKKSGADILFTNNEEIQFTFRGEKVNFFPLTGWATGRSITDGIGLYRLLTQIS